MLVWMCTSMWINKRRLSCHDGYQEISRCHTKSEKSIVLGDFEESIACRQWNMQVRDPPWLCRLQQKTKIKVSLELRKGLLPTRKIKKRDPCSCLEWFSVRQWIAPIVQSHHFTRWLFSPCNTVTIRRITCHAYISVSITTIHTSVVRTLQSASLPFIHKSSVVCVHSDDKYNTNKKRLTPKTFIYNDVTDKQISWFGHFLIMIKLLKMLPPNPLHPNQRISWL